MGGKMARSVVFRGTKAKTLSGLTKNKRGKIVSKKQAANGKKAYANIKGHCCCPEGQEGFGRQGLRRSEEGNPSLQEGQGTLPVSMHMSIPRLQLRAWGCLRPWSAVALGGTMHGEYH